MTTALVLSFFLVITICFSVAMVCLYQYLERQLDKSHDFYEENLSKAYQVIKNLQDEISQINNKNTETE